MERHLLEAKRVLQEHAASLTQENTATCLALARQLVSELEDLDARLEPLPRITYSPEVNSRIIVDETRRIAHFALGDECGDIMLKFVLGPTHLFVLYLMVGASTALLVLALLVETSAGVSWSCVCMNCYLGITLIATLHFDVALKVMQTFDFWYLNFQAVAVYCVLFPMSMQWDERAWSILSLGVLIGSVLLLADAWPPVISDLGRFGWATIAPPLTALLALGLELDWFVNLERPQLSFRGFEWDVQELMQARLLVLFVFGLKAAFKYTFNDPTDAWFFKVPQQRSDIQERFLIFRELGCLPAGSHVSFARRLQLRRHHAASRSTGSQLDGANNTSRSPGSASVQQPPPCGSSDKSDDGVALASAAQSESTLRNETSPSTVSIQVVQRVPAGGVTAAAQNRGGVLGTAGSLAFKLGPDALALDLGSPPSGSPGPVLTTSRVGSGA